MKTFRFYQDIQITRTYREYYDISAKSLKDARRKASEVDNLRDCEDAEYYDSEDVLVAFPFFGQPIIRLIG